MRLINVDTRVLEDFHGRSPPKYAILSHTWDEEEVSHAQYVRGGYENMKGFTKINMACRIAKEREIHYVWVDTCCIDKASSAELSEAINSMFRWYRDALECYAYLSDLRPGADWAEELSQCRWFTRGWTLQELIAPPSLIFFDCTWNSTIDMTERSRSHLAPLLATITKIDAQMITGPHGNRFLHSARCCVAQKMSWAADRVTTREEDMAYCLLGIFGVNMPLLYGEGEQAFIRLQKEIMRSSADLSILAWCLPPPFVGADQPFSLFREATEQHTIQFIGLLATSPNYFRGCGSHQTLGDSGAREFTITNVGIKLRTRLYLDCTDRTLVLPLNCTPSSSGPGLALQLLHLGRQRYARIDPTSTIAFQTEDFDPDLPTEIYLLTNYIYNLGFVENEAFKSVSRLNSVRIRPLLGKTTVSNPWPRNWYDRSDQSFFIGHDQSYDMCTIDICLPTSDKSALWITLVAAGWADSSTCAQFGIFPAREYEGVLTEVKTLLYRSRQGTRAFLKALNHQGIPRMQYFRAYLEETDECAVITITQQRHPPNNNVCMNHYYTLDLDVVVYDNIQRAPIDEEKLWDTSSLEPTVSLH